MRITEITDQHLINRIRHFERFLETKPPEAYYMGESSYAEQAVECENQQNEMLAERISNHIKRMKSELKKRGLSNLIKK